MNESYANAIPLELLKAEQDRVTAAEQSAKAELDVTEDDLAGWQDVLSMAIQLAGNCHAAYLKASPSVRQRFNEAVLEAVYVKDRRIWRAEFSEVFAPLFSRPSSNKPLKVGRTGFEPVTHGLKAHGSNLFYLRKRTPSRISRHVCDALEKGTVQSSS